MIINKVKKSREKIYLVILRGQSHAHGAALTARLGNTNFNYKGIYLGYPSVRTTQGQYSATPTGCYQYVKKMVSVTSDNWLSDNSSWMSYNAADTRVDSTQQFGCELSLLTAIQERTNSNVYLIKCAQSGTSLAQSATPSSLGNHNYTNLKICKQFINYALRDLKILKPNADIILIADIWSQGENDASNGLTGANYIIELEKYEKDYQNFLQGELNTNKCCRFYTKLKFNETPQESSINSSVESWVSTRNKSFFINLDAYPQRNDLTVLENAPSGVVGSDDQHLSYIAMLSAGELMFETITY